MFTSIHLTKESRSCWRIFAVATERILACGMSTGKMDISLSNCLIQRNDQAIAVHQLSYARGTNGTTAAFKGLVLANP
jgi:hypothetical protein